MRSTTIYDSKGKNPIKIVLPDDNSIHVHGREIKVGDRIKIKVQFQIEEITYEEGDTIPSEIDFQTANYKDYLYFRFDPDREFVDYEIPEESVIFTRNADTTTSKILGHVHFDCWFHSDDLDSGNKVVSLFSRTSEDSGLVNTGFNDEFYLHQSLRNYLQDNIANGGIAGERKGLDRDKVNFPTYLPIGLQPVNPIITSDVALWTVIRDGTEALSFKSYSDFMDFIFCGKPNPFRNGDEIIYKDRLKDVNSKRNLPFSNVDSYRALKVATEAFVMASVASAGTHADSDLYNAYREEVSIIGDEPGVKILPYLALIRRKMIDIDFKSSPFEDALSSYVGHREHLMETCYGLIASKLENPCFLELIWSYWHEESMMVQGIGTIARRFQNIRGEGAVDPLANLEVGPLRPLNNLMWGYVQDEQHRLTVRRRAYEYDHHYGISLQGTAVKGLRPADSRSKFIEAFHMLLNLCTRFYHQYDDTTVVADGFPIMNALKEVHMILSEGAHNQYGDLPSTARIEMLMQQYILARPEFREFLPTRQMVAYPEAWMDRVGVLNQMHNWTKTNVMHFRDLGKFGEQIILSIRFGAWSDVIDRNQAANWAIFWRPQIQNYIHSYRAVAGIDLSREDGTIDAQQPSVHLLRRLNEQNSKVKV